MIAVRLPTFSLGSNAWQDDRMMQKIVKKHRLQDHTTVQDDLAYWLTKTPEERVATVDYLRAQYHGNATRLQRVARVVQRPPSE